MSAVLLLPRSPCVCSVMSNNFKGIKNDKIHSKNNKHNIHEHETHPQI